MNYDLYKSHLWQYLNAKGIKTQKGSICCFNPAHNDPNPSCKLDEESFYCFGCGAKGDIYDAVALLEGIESRTEQYKFVEQFCGGHFEPKPVARAEKSEDEKTVRDAVAALDDREREIIELRYGLRGGKELTQKEVADKMGISQSYISRLEKRIIVRLRKQIAKRV